jgi:hypothetical protein
MRAREGRAPSRVDREAGFHAIARRGASFGIPLRFAEARYPAAPERSNRQGRLTECRSTKAARAQGSARVSESEQAAFATSVIRNDTLADTSATNTGLLGYTDSGLLSLRTTCHHVLHWGHGGVSDVANLVNR